MSVSLILGWLLCFQGAVSAPQANDYQLGAGPTVPGCPLTEQEKKILNYVRERQDRASNGTIASQIKAGTYTVDSLSADMYRWWVQLGMADHGTAIEDFVNLMQQAQQRAEKKNFLAILFGWLGLIFGALGEGAEIIKEAVEAMENALETMKEAAAAEDGDFLAVAIKFRSQLPTKETTELLAVDNFINGIRNIPKSKLEEGLLAAYSQVTKVIERTVSYRLAFNQYYISFLDGAFPSASDREFYLGFSLNYPIAGIPNPYGVIWRSTPSGLDACFIAAHIYNLNLGCVGKRTPGFQNYTSGAWDLVLIGGEPAPGWRLDCSGAAVGCWFPGGGYYNIGDWHCSEVHYYENWDPSQMPAAAKDFCSNGMLPSNQYTVTACNGAPNCGPGGEAPNNLNSIRDCGTFGPFQPDEASGDRVATKLVV